MESETSFDPSGSSGAQNQIDSSSSEDSRERAQSWHGDSASETTDLTSLSHNLTSLSIEKNEGSEILNSDAARYLPENEELEALPVKIKIEKLHEMFPTIKEFDIQFVLKKYSNDFGKAVEELLNQAFFERESVSGQSTIPYKGIDAFSESTARGAKGKGKRRRQTRRTSSTPALSDTKPASPSANPSRWDRAKEDVNFIVQRTYLSASIVTSIYHKSGASIPSTVAALCTSDLMNSNPYLHSLNANVLNAHVTELSIDLPVLPYETAKALVRLTHPSTASAHELARSLVAFRVADLDVITPHYLPRPPSPVQDNRYKKTNPPSLPLDTANRRAIASSVARSAAFSQASAAYRQSKSKPLMGGAASYYSSVGRDASESVKRYEAAAADAQVASQSTKDEVDLHGINVRDALRIVHERVESWWEAEGQEWARGGKVMGGKGLKIVTGIGRHSEGGRGKLGPAVGSMLVREGWKLEIGEGVLTVVGRSRGRE